MQTRCYVNNKHTHNIQRETIKTYYVYTKHLIHHIYTIHASNTLVV